MVKYLIIINLFIGYSFKCFSQLPPATDVVNGYTIAQKRLLIISTAQFINLVTQNNLDQDSVLSMACSITKLPFLTSYTEGAAYKPSAGTNLMNTGRPGEAAKLVNRLAGNEQLQLLVQLATWYIQQPEAYKTDLDSAAKYLAIAAQLSAASRQYKFWENECRYLQAILTYQSGNVTEAKTQLQQLLTIAEPALMAKTNRQLANWLPDTDSAKLTYLQTSLKLYKELQLKEEEIEALLNLAIYDFVYDLKSSKNKMKQVLGLEQSTGFRHTLYIKNILSHLSVLTEDYVTAAELANEAIDNMRWTGYTILEPAFLYRLGNIFSIQDNIKEAMVYYQKALEHKTAESQIFWFTSANVVAGILASENRGEEGASLFKNIVHEYPPVLPWHKMQVASTLGLCYEMSGNFQLADKYYTDLLALEDQFPEADPHGQVTTDYFSIADYYTTNNKLKKAHLFLTRALSHTPKSKTHAALYLSLTHKSLYKLDSMEGNYKSALRNFSLHKIYNDSAINADQRHKLEEVMLKYETEKKDKDISLLKKQALVTQAQLKQNRLTKNVTLTGIVLLLAFTALLFNQYRTKQRANKLISKKNDALNKLVTEKEWLLKEIHHRVKNNLQTVVSLLELQPDYLQQEALSAIRDSRNRIYAMSLIHQKLYQSENIASVNMRFYLVELLNHLQDIYNIEGRIRMHIRVAPIELDVSQAIPVGLIVNEAVTNCIKHAFTGNVHGAEMTISLENTVTGLVELVISDNGTGLPVEVEKAKNNGFGFRLMKGLVEDIEGKFMVEPGPSNGTRISVCFTINIPFTELNNEKTSEKALIA